MRLKHKLARLSVRGLAPGMPEGPPQAGAVLPPAPERDFVAVPSLDDARRGKTSEQISDEAAAQSRAVRLRSRIDALRQAQPAQPAPDANAGAWAGCVVQTPAGPLCQIMTAHAADFVQGQAAVSPCLTVTGAQMAALALDQTLGVVKSERLLFLDTETTGLAGGAGTVPFLIGAAYFTDGQLIVEQWMLRKLGEEAPMLARLAELLAKAEAIVTYNGKSFDWPLLRNRFILNRVKMPAPRPHLDLLHCSRRLLKRREPHKTKGSRGGLRLTAVERDVLGFSRVGDIDGAHIPERYFAYLRGAPCALLDPVLEHNRHDLVSLAALLGIIGHKVEDTHQQHSACEHLNLAEIALRGQHTARAVAFATAAQVASLRSDAHVCAEAALLLGRMCVRQKQFAEARAAFEAGLIDGTSFHAGAQAAVCLALAKLLEHRLGDLGQAMHYAGFTARIEGPQAHAGRMARLLRKLARDTPQQRVHTRLAGQAALRPRPSTVGVQGSA